jgi:hypothetical protein
MKIVVGEGLVEQSYLAGRHWGVVLKIHLEAR